MLPSTRRQFKLNVAPSDNELMAIGMVAVHWSALEQLAKVYAHAFADGDEAWRSDYDTTLVTKHRYRKLREIVDQKAKEPYRTDIINIIDAITGIQAERDKIVHRRLGL